MMNYETPSTSHLNEISSSQTFRVMFETELFRTVFNIFLKFTLFTFWGSGGLDDCRIFGFDETLLVGSEINLGIIRP